MWRFDPNIVGHAQRADELFTLMNIRSRTTLNSRTVSPILSPAQLATGSNGAIRAHVAGPRLIRTGETLPLDASSSHSRTGMITRYLIGMSTATAAPTPAGSHDHY